ncbi:adenylate cyclase [Coleofasciculus chthonoplastes PCC 7420]|uniref:Adenylate cyclase n=1 Tax=Coleofasciculus chthonoplastes PCC 7420 TaxID=118168 RepID=B4VJ85_9CYAN|nr:CYTH domain-containing protein [Coleofasciculus chthonoplastes]EDX78002.1 adenylate cyclase [Coleofasciculus chthonoplastes PCC 7420]
MAIEIERKFLVKGDQWRTLGQGMLYRQGYIATHNLTTVRVRLVGDQGYLTIKGKTDNFSRVEYEYPIPGSDAQEMLETLCDRPLIEKTRYRIECKGLVWEVDEFMGENEGLIFAEVELTDENQDVELPDWIGQEVTGDPHYYNANLVRHPFSQWS